MNEDTVSSPPIVCDMTDARDTAAERVAEYQRLFTEALVGRQHTDDGIRFRFRADAGMEDWVRDLAAREKACCAWYDFDVTAVAGEIVWDIRAPDDDVARRLLEDFYRLPDTISIGATGLLEQYADHGLQVMIRDGDALRPASETELGLT